MKKVLSLLLAIVMVLSLAACGASEPTTAGKNDPTTKPSTGTTTKPTTAPTEPTDPTDPTDPSEPDDENDIGYPETVIADNDHCTFKILSISSTDLTYTLKVSLENKSSVAQMFSLSGVTVNDYVCDPFWACEVSAGASQVSEITFLRSDLAHNGITDPTKIEFYLSIYDNEGWEAKEFFGRICTVYPMGEDNHVDDGGYTAQEGDIILVDNDSVTVIVTGYDPDNFWGYTMNLYLENKTDKNLTFDLDNVTVNDLILDPWWFIDVAAGKRAHCSVTWMGTEMDDYNVGDVTMIGFDLSAMDVTDWEAIDLADVSTTVYPMGEEAAKSYERPAQDSDIILLDNAYVTVIVSGIDPDGMLGYTVDLFIENKSDMTLRVDADDVSINGFSMDPWWATTISAGKCIYSSISWFTSDLKDNGITTVEAIVMTLKVYDEEAWEPFTSDAVTINP